MKYLILKLSILLIPLCVLNTAYAQSKLKRNTKIIQIPQKYIKPTGSVIDTKLEKLPVSGPKNDWVVYSNSDNNPTYDAPNGVPTDKKMQFMDDFYVVGETETHLRIVKYDPTLVASSSRKVDVKKIESADYDYGWVKKDQMLLWRHSLVNSINDFNLRALIVHNVYDFFKGVGGEHQLTLYNSPELEEEYRNENDIRLFEFLYVFSKIGDSYLVGNSSELPRSTVGSQKVIRGWISEKNIELWSDRLCIEPNDDAAASAERRSNGIKASLLINYQVAEKFKAEGKVPSSNSRKDVLWDRDNYDAGYPPSWKRMPVMSKLDNNIYKTGVITDIFNKNNFKVLDPLEHAKLEKDYNELRDKMQNINIVFVIDGTESNHSFFVPIINSINKSLNLLENPDKRYKIGAFVYGKSGEGVVAEHPLTSVHSKVIRGLEKYRDKTGIPQDNDDATDVYVALKAALRAINPKQTNIIVLIGDAGNSAGDSNYNITKKMKDSECGIISFQTRNVEGPQGRVYNQFITQTKDIITLSSQRSAIKPPTLYQDEATNTFRLRFPIESLAPGSLTYSSKGSSMSSTKLQEEIRTMLRTYEEQHERLLRDLDCKIYIDCKPDINEAILEYFLQKIPNVDISKIRAMDHQLFVEAYASLQVDKLEEPIFKHVLFLTDTELYDLYRSLEKIVQPGLPPSQLRQEIINSYKEILIRHYGTDIAGMSSRTLAELTEDLTGLPSRSDLLNKYTIRDLGDRKEVTDYEIEDIFAYIEGKLEAFKRVRGNPQFFFRSRDQTYYWVPQEVLP